MGDRRTQTPPAPTRASLNLSDFFFSQLSSWGLHGHLGGRCGEEEGGNLMRFAWGSDFAGSPVGIPGSGFSG